MNRTAEQLMDLENIANWLEQQPQHGVYHYWHGGNCLLARYYKAMGYNKAVVGLTKLHPNWDDDADGRYLAIPPEINKVAYGSPRLFRTFGGALKRARRLLNAETQAYALQEAGAR